MASHFFQNALARDVAIAGYRLYARSQVWRTGPRIFVNSIPKAGTHLLISELKRHPALQDSGLWVRARFVNQLAANNERIKDFDLDKQAFSRMVGTVRNGQFFWAHLHHDPKIFEVLSEGDIKTVFVIRHPLDVLVSNFHYIKSLKRHSKHDFFVNTLTTDAERIDALINGNQSPYMGSMRAKLEEYLGWLKEPDVLTVKYEDLVGERGGGDDRLRGQTFAAIYEHCGLERPERLISADASRTSATFRKGKIRNWADTLSDADTARAWSGIEDLATQYGYTL